MNARNKIQKNIYELSIKIIWLLIFILWEFVNCAGVTANQRLLSKKGVSFSDRMIMKGDPFGRTVYISVSEDEKKFLQVEKDDLLMRVRTLNNEGQTLVEIIFADACTKVQFNSKFYDEKDSSDTFLKELKYFEGYLFGNTFSDVPMRKQNSYIMDIHNVLNNSKCSIASSPDLKYLMVGGTIYNTETGKVSFSNKRSSAVGETENQVQKQENIAYKIYSDGDWSVARKNFHFVGKGFISVFVKPLSKEFAITRFVPKVGTDFFDEELVMKFPNPPDEYGQPRQFQITPDFRWLTFYTLENIKSYDASKDLHTSLKRPKFMFYDLSKSKYINIDLPKTLNKESFKQARLLGVQSISFKKDSIDYYPLSLVVSPDSSSVAINVIIDPHAVEFGSSLEKSVSYIATLIKRIDIQSEWRIQAISHTIYDHENFRIGSSSIVEGHKTQLLWNDTNLIVSSEFYQNGICNRGIYDALSGGLLIQDNVCSYSNSLKGSKLFSVVSPFDQLHRSGENGYIFKNPNRVHSHHLDGSLLSLHLTDLEYRINLENLNFETRQSEPNKASPQIQDVTFTRYFSGDKNYFQIRNNVEFGMSRITRFSHADDSNYNEGFHNPYLTAYLDAGANIVLSAVTDDVIDNTKNHEMTNMANKYALLLVDKAKLEPGKDPVDVIKDSTLIGFFKSPAREMSLSTDKKNLVAVHFDDSITIWDMEKQIFRLGMRIRNGHPIFFNPMTSNYWAASDSLNEVSWLSGTEIKESIWKGNTITRRQYEIFDLNYNRPDLIFGEAGSRKEKITLYSALMERRRKLNGLSASSQSDSASMLPLIKTTEKKINGDSFSFSVNMRTDRFKVLQTNIYPDFLPIPNIIGYKVWANGVPVYGDYIKQTYPKSDKVIKAKDVSISETITLAQGDNKIEISAFTEDGVESPRESFTVRYEPPVKRKPDLYFVGIGVDEYNPTVSGGLDTLTYAVKDSKELEDTFTKSGKTSFGNVFTKVITNKEVNQTSIRALREFLGKSKVDDHVILFLSGHGIRKDTKISDLLVAFGDKIPEQYKLRDKGDLDDIYYYMTSEANVDKPWEKGIPLDGIRDLVNGIPSRQKIMLVDTCQSGEKLDLDDQTVASLTKNIEIRKTRGQTAKTRGLTMTTKPGASNEKKEDTEKKIIQSIAKSNALKEMSDLFPELRRGTGTIEISAATGAQSALESKEWQNGAFTFVIKEAVLKGKAKDKNGNITAQSLRRYVLDEVEKLTDGQQTPMVARDIAGRDFVIFGK